MFSHRRLLVLPFMGVLFSACGPKSEDSLEAPRFGFSSEFLGTVGGCQAVLFSETEALFHSSCLGETAWFRIDQREESFPILNRNDTESGLSVVSFSIPVRPRYASLDVDYNGWDSRKVTMYDGGIVAECEAKKDGSHNCKCIRDSHPSLVFDGHVMGIIERCESADRTGIFIPTYMLSATRTE